jgi:hypothetical protein
MGISNVLSWLTLGAVTVVLLPITAQQPTSPMSLTADDHMQIQRLVMRFGHAVIPAPTPG